MASLYLAKQHIYILIYKADQETWQWWTNDLKLQLHYKVCEEHTVCDGVNKAGTEVSDQALGSPVNFFSAGIFTLVFLYLTGRVTP